MKRLPRLKRLIGFITTNVLENSEITQGTEERQEFAIIEGYNK
jgi:hypothetical protein